MALQERPLGAAARAWGVNGGASVVGSIAAIVLAITLGFPAVTGIGLTLYAIAVAAMLSATRGETSV